MTHLLRDAFGVADEVTHDPQAFLAAVHGRVQRRRTWHRSAVTGAVVATALVGIVTLLAINGAPSSVPRPAGTALTGREHPTDQGHPIVEPIRLAALTGGELTTGAYRGQSLVLVAGPADGVRRVVDRLLPMTGRGRSPRVLGLLTAVPGGDFKGTLLNPGDAAAYVASVARAQQPFFVPVGVDIKGNVRARFTPYVAPFGRGAREPDGAVAIVLVRSDGRLDRVVLDVQVSNGQLHEWIGALS